MKKLFLLSALCAFTLYLAFPGSAAQKNEKNAVTFSKDVAPILQQRCEECHHQGGMAPMSLVTFEEVRPWAKSIREKVVTREMPPFHASGPVGRYVDDPRLTDAEIETIKAWVEGGVAKGDPKHSPAPRAWPEGWKLGQPDLVLTINQPYTVKRDNKDDYVFFAFDYIFPEDTWVQGVEIRPGNRKAVHHANIHIIPADYQNPPAGYASGRTMVGQFLAGWAPGGTPRLQPKGYGALMRKGTRLGLQLHYAPTKDVVTDQTSIGFYFADGHLTKRTQLLHGGTRNIVIPPGEANYQIIEKRTFPTDALVRAFTAHMHVRGKSFVVKLHYPDGRVETAFDIPRYDFNWQRSYPLAQPISVPKGAVAEYIATWDNSKQNKFNPDPTQAVKWGENTTDEMMGGFLNYEAVGETLDIWVKKGRRVTAPESTSSAAAQASRAAAPVLPFEMVKQTLDVGMVVSDREKAREFYGEVFGYKELPAFKTPDGGEMLRFQAGTTTLKLNVLPKTPPKYPGGTNAGIGFRLLTLIVADADRVLKNIVSNGQPEPKTMPGPNGMKLAFIQDPDGNQIELVGLPAGADAATADRAQFGFTVSDVEKTREFYGKILGLPEQEPKAMALMKGAMKYSFTAGQNTIKFWAGGKDLPIHTGRANEAVGLRYLTFMVKDVEAVHQLLKSRGARVALAPFDFGGVARVMFIADPDGNYIEFAQLTPRAKASGNQ